MDWAYIRKFNNCEPSTLVGVEQTQCPPPVPLISSPVVYCQNDSGVPLTATGTSLLWYTVPSGGTGNATAPTPTTTSPGTISYYVSQTIDGCEGARAQIDIQVNALPDAPVITITQPICSLPTGEITVTSAVSGLSFSIDGVDYSNTSGILTGINPGIMI